MWCSGDASAPHARLGLGPELASLHFDLWGRYIPVAVYAVAQLDRKLSLAGLARRIRQRSVAAVRRSLKRFKSNRDSSTAEMKQSLM